MARHRRRQLNPDLFPFLSVVVCVIGVLAFLIAVLVAVGAELQAREPLAASEPDPESSRTAAVMERESALSKEIAIISEAVSRARAADQAFDALVSEIEQLRTKAEAAAQGGTDSGGLADLVVRRRGLEADVDISRNELSALRRTIDATPAPPAPSPAQQPAVQIVFPATSRSGLLPIFVECAATGVTVYPEREFIPSEQIESGDLFRALLTRVKQDPKCTLAFMVRPDGVKIFDKARSTARAASVRYGYVPAPGSGKITFDEGKP
jgi:hypothetical protein